MSSGRVTSERTKHRILVVDDHPIVVDGLRAVLQHEPDMEFCGGAEDVAGALRLIDESPPDLVVIDIALKKSHGLELVSLLKERHPQVKTLVWSMFDEKVFAERVLRAGASGFINKEESIQQVVEAIRRVLDGQIYLSRPMTGRLLRRIHDGGFVDDDPIRRLSDRELQVLDMIGRGMTTKQIAKNLDLSPKTVETHRENIKGKLELRSGAELSRFAYQWVSEKH